MKLYTHNFLRNNAMDCETGYPLTIEVDEFVTNESEFSAEKVVHLLNNLNWPCLRLAAEQCGIESLPEELSDELMEDNSFLEAIHHVLFDVEIVRGQMICPDTGRSFPIENGIPNMMFYHFILCVEV